MIIAEGAAIIPLLIEGIILNSTVVWDEHMAILIDAGFCGHGPQILEGMRRAGVPAERLSAVILTHQDIDHIGGVQELMELVGRPLTVYAHALDQPHIEGAVPLLKRELPPQLQHMFDLPYQVKVNHTLMDGDVLDCCGGVEVIYTPGHTPGHISLYVQSSRILIAGDALPSADGELQPPTNQTTPDLPAAFNSLRRFLDYDIGQIVCYHGGLCTKNVQEQLRRIVEHSSRELIIPKKEANEL
ncbi:MBL fold metallo-hydrolase [Paenibacillus sp. sgz5001063]|uniref:MBL fold metallo-hydrolase n=1 Tax=Paenibacillus sp. sgz5001063 TaxID=3242474 RepID=UPI0036D354F3